MAKTVLERFLREANHKAENSHACPLGLLSNPVCERLLSYNVQGSQILGGGFYQSAFFVFQGGIDVRVERSQGSYVFLEGRYSCRQFVNLSR